MNAILMSLMEKKMLGLSVYDSVIVAAEHETTLKKIMINEYQA
jgi:hypothetical protein